MKSIKVPYRACFIGANSDHQQGKTLSIALDKGVKFTYEESDKVVLTSKNFDGEVSWKIDEVSIVREDDWADYFRGVTLLLFLWYKVSRGVRGRFEGELPIGGLASSSSSALAFLLAMCDINHLELSSEEMIKIIVTSENNYVGVQCGRLDPVSELYCKENELLYIDMKDDSKENLSSDNFDLFDIIVFFTGEDRRLADSSFNDRVIESHRAAYLLDKKECLRDVPYETFVKNSYRLPDDLLRRATHYYNEVFCVEKGKDAWVSGNLEEFGVLMTESGNSVIENYETSSEALNTLQKIISNVDGVYGVRPAGAGIKGACIALVDKNKTRDVLEQVSEKYLDKYPEHSYNYSHCVCKSCDGIEFRR